MKHPLDKPARRSDIETTFGLRCFYVQPANPLITGSDFQHRLSSVDGSFLTNYEFIMIEVEYSCMNTFSGLIITRVLLSQTIGTPALLRIRINREGLINILTEKMKLQEDNNVFSHCPFINQSDNSGGFQF